MRVQRERSQSEVVEVGRQYLNVNNVERFTRAEAHDTLGKTWSNIVDVTVGGENPVRHLQAAIDHLRDLGYVVSIESDDVIVIHVSTSYDVAERLEKGEEA